MTTKARPPARSARANAAGERGLFVNSIQKGFAVLKAFTRERPHLTHAAITRITGLDKSAAQRILYTLHQMGLLNKDDDTKQYRLSAKLLEFGYAYLYSDPLIERAQPFLVEAHEKTGETVNLAVLDGTDIILVSRLPSRHVVSLNIQIGFRIPALYSASGRVMAARMMPEERRRFVRAAKLQRHTPTSVVDAGKMEHVIDAARSEGYSLVHSQYFPNDISVAAAVVDGKANVVGAISISAPDSRITVEDARKQFVPVAIEAARKISLTMGAF
jgi:DNA-binding IclR family transcriptional regulator